jgi:hypothetical protein
MAYIGSGYTGLPAKQLLGFQHEKWTRRSSRQPRGGDNFGGKCTSSHEEIDLDLDAAGFPRVVLVVEIPLSQSVFIDAVLQLLPESNCDLFDGSRDFRPFTECSFAVDLRDVV